MREFEETEHKAAALRRAIDLAAGQGAALAGPATDGSATPGTRAASGLPR